MPIHPSDPPSEAIRAVSQALADRAAKSAFLSSDLRRAKADALAIAMPHRVAYLPLDKTRRDANLREDALIGPWRFIVYERRRRDANERPVTDIDQYVPIAAATADPTAAAQYELGELNEGPFVAGTDNAIRLAENLEAIQKGDFEAFLLTVPAVHVVALWLQDRGGHEDILMPIPPSNPTLVAYQPVTPRAFLDILHDLTKKVAAGG
jgi:hypothetical protein